MTKFTHLHVHSEFSLLNGLPKISKLVSKAKELGFTSLALTDRNALYGAIQFSKECKSQNIKPIIGCEINFSLTSTGGKAKPDSKEPIHLTLLAKNFAGYQNLMQLVTLANINAKDSKPYIDIDLVKKFGQNLIILSGCFENGLLPSLLVDGENEKARRLVNELEAIVGKESFYLEIENHQIDRFIPAFSKDSPQRNQLETKFNQQEKIKKEIIKLSKDLLIPLVATNDVHYLESEDAQAQDILTCIGLAKTLADLNRKRMADSPTYYLRSADEMKRLFDDLPKALENTEKIAKVCDLEIPIGKIELPDFDVPSGTTPKLYLKELVYSGAKNLITDFNQEVTDRLEYELSIIEKKNYAGYFLIVADFVNWARKKGIVSTTRGSAAGSLVTYTLGITTVNPLDFQLPFERFLHPSRPSFPDLDIDFADIRRDEVIDYVKKKYGEDRVAQIGTFGTMMARAAVRDVARVLGWPYLKADRVAKMIPFGSQGFPMTIKEAININPELSSLLKSDAEVKELLELAQKIEGNARHASIHAAGVVIAPKPITYYTPLQKESGGDKIITQYDMYSIEEAGLVKMDFLGIRNLSILGQAVEIVQKRHGIKIDLTKILLDDRKAFDILAKGETMGLFQLSGSGMTRYLKELKPSNIFDIMAMIALFRPGPMNSIPEFIARKHDTSKITYFDERMKDFLKESYGVITYQDDVLLTAINIAGYNWEEVDKFRKAIGKKIPAEMAKQKDHFIKGCVENGLSKTKAEQLFKLIEPFSAYGFNKAHAASYAIVAYQTAYMKANFQVEFMTAVMSAEADDTEKISAAVNECHKMKIPILPPDVNYSQIGFTIEESEKGKEGIRFGLSAIKNVGHSAITAVFEARQKGGQFKSLKDFCQRVNLRVVNRKTLESLIKAGAMDAYGNRNSMLAALDSLKKEGASLASKIAEGQTTFFDKLEDAKEASFKSNEAINSYDEAPQEELLAWEKQLLGFYLSHNPISELLPLIMQMTTHKIETVKEMRNENNQKVIIGGMITSCRKTITRTTGSQMAFAKLEDDTGNIEVVVFPKIYSASKEFLLMDQPIIVEGETDWRDENVAIIARNISSIETKDGQSQKVLEVKLPFHTDRLLLRKVYQTLKSFPGNNKTMLILPGSNGQLRKVPVPITANISNDLVKSLLNLGCKIQS